MKIIGMGLAIILLLLGASYAADPIVGATLYGSNCQRCHGAMSRMMGRTAAQIQNAISANRGGMGSIQLTSTQIADITAALSTTQPQPHLHPGRHL